MSWTKVKNVHNYSSPVPAGYSCWLDYWEKNSGIRATTCCAYDCNARAEVGAHVIKVDSNDNRWFIVPLCQACSKRTDEFYVPSDYLIPSNK